MGFSFHCVGGSQYPKGFSRVNAKVLVSFGIRAKALDQVISFLSLNLVLEFSLLIRYKVAIFNCFEFISSIGFVIS